MRKTGFSHISGENNTGLLTNDDHESREMTEMDENVMRPINLNEHKNSIDPTQKNMSKDLMLLVSSDDQKSRDSKQPMPRND